MHGLYPPATFRDAWAIGAQTLIQPEILLHHETARKRLGAVGGPEKPLATDEAADASFAPNHGYLPVRPFRSNARQRLRPLAGATRWITNRLNSTAL